MTDKALALSILDGCIKRVHDNTFQYAYASGFIAALFTTGVITREESDAYTKIIDAKHMGGDQA